MLQAIGSEPSKATQITILTKTAGRFANVLQEKNPTVRREAISALVQRIQIHSDKLIITLKTPALAEGGTDNIHDDIRLEYSIIQKRKGVETRLIIGGRPCNTPDPKLIKAITKSRIWYQQLKSGERLSLNP